MASRRSNGTRRPALSFSDRIAMLANERRGRQLFGIDHIALLRSNCQLMDWVFRPEEKKLRAEIASFDGFRGYPLFEAPFAGGA